MPDHPPDPSRSARRAAALVFFVLGPVAIAVAVAYALTAPRLFSASTEFQLNKPGADVTGIATAFQTAQAKYATLMQGEALAEKVRIDQMDVPEKFRITATDPQPIRAMHSANGLILMVRDAMRQADDDLPLPLVLLAKAEMPTKPSHPDVPLIMKLGVSTAVLCVVAGVFLRRGSRRLRPSAAHSSQDGPPAHTDSDKSYDY